MTGRLGEEELKALERVFRGNNLSRYSWEDKIGECDRFESELAEKFGARHSILLSGGTNALISALSGLGIGPGDEVIVPAYTYIATPGAVLAAGAVPVFANIDASLMIDPQDLAKRITRRTKAVIPVHMSGLACDMDRIMDVAKRAGVHVIEDACQSMGGEYGGRKLGTIGVAGAYSFNTHKILTCGEGGALITSDEGLYKKAFINHDMGIYYRPYLEKLDTPVFVGKSMRVSEISGAIMRVQLTRLDGILANLRGKKKIYQKVLSEARCGFPVNHSPEGDCGVAVPLMFASAEECARAVTKVRELGVYCEQLSHYYRHVFSHWDPILNKRVAHHPELNPFRHREDFSYDLREYEKSADLLARTMIYFVYLAADHTAEQTEDLAREMRNKINQI